jgi:hypothetical protein
MRCAFTVFFLSVFWHGLAVTYRGSTKSICSSSLSCLSFKHIVLKTEAFPSKLKTTYKYHIFWSCGVTMCGCALFLKYVQRCCVWNIICESSTSSCLCKYVTQLISDGYKISPSKQCVCAGWIFVIRKFLFLV